MSDQKRKLPRTLAPATALHMYIFKQSIKQAWANTQKKQADVQTFVKTTNMYII